MRNTRDYATITASYWVFTLTDGALRTLVLFHLHSLGYSPLEVVSLFLFYELFGVFTNFAGGWLGTRFGLKSTLFAGLALQIIACTSLALMVDNLSVPLVMAAQALSGIAKDLTKMSAKSYVKLVVPHGDGSALMRLVALLTGSKNTLKGVGLFAGGAMLETVGFRSANVIMAFTLGAALVASFALLPRAAGQSKAKIGLRGMISSDSRIHWLAAARLFLFGSRDAWFVFALPIFLSVDLAWSSSESSAFLAIWIIGYGIVQALAPIWVGGARGRAAPDAGRVGRWTALLAIPLLALSITLPIGIAPTTVLVAGLAVFGIVFASGSAMHSYLIVRYAERDEVALRVGFYYTANAAGRLLGTILSGAVFQWAGMGVTGLCACIATACGLTLVSALCCVPLRRAELRVGRVNPLPDAREDRVAGSPP